MKFTKLFLAVIVTASLLFVGCKPKDAEIKANVEKALAADPMMTGTSVNVKDGIVTITGECQDEACRAMCEKTVKAVKGVKSVINNCTIVAASAPPPASTTTMLNEATQQQIRDGFKDIPGVTVVFTADKAVISGAVTAANRMKIMQMLAAAKVVSDVSNLKDKK